MMKKRSGSNLCALIEEQKPGSRIEACATGEELLASGKRFDAETAYGKIQTRSRGGTKKIIGIRGGKQYGTIFKKAKGT